MSYLESILLGVVQGLTEFLPISSSGHLVLAQYFLGVHEPQVFFDVMLHLGTLGAVVVGYREALGRLVASSWRALRDPGFWRRPVASVRASPELTLIFFLALGSVPTAVIGLAFQDQLEAGFGSPRIVALMLIVTGVLLQAPRLRPDRGRAGGPLRWWHAPLIGVVQGLAIIPGFSRAGSTISVALLAGARSEDAAEFSFLLSIPAILGAVVVKLGDLGVGGAPPAGVVAAGALSAFVVGYLSLVFLLLVLRKGRLGAFSWYCFVVGAAALFALS